VDEAWGEEEPTIVRRIRLVDELTKELEARDDKGTPVNWSAVLPVANDGFVTLTRLPPAPGLLAHPNALLQFVQKRMPLAKALTKLGSDGIEGETQIDIANVTIGPVSKAPDRRLDDNFPIAQFIDLKEDDLLSKPSFDRFESGFEVGQRDYLFGSSVADKFDYEEVNLSTPGSGRFLAGIGLYTAAHMSWALESGAAGRSALRARARRLPKDEAKMAVNPPPLQTLDTAAGAMTGAALNGRAATSYWHAHDVAAAAGQGIEVVEMFEMSF
jgi:hypothetical protein